MKKYRTACLILLSAGCGIGSGIIGYFGYGLYSILLFVAFPFVVAGLFLSIVQDVLHEQPAHEVAQPPSLEEEPTTHIPRAA